MQQSSMLSVTSKTNNKPVSNPLYKSAVSLILKKGAQNTLHSGCRTRQTMRFFCVHRFHLWPSVRLIQYLRGIRPPTVYGFERLAAISKVAIIKIYTGGHMSALISRRPKRRNLRLQGTGHRLRGMDQPGISPQGHSGISGSSRQGITGAGSDYESTTGRISYPHCRALSIRQRPALRMVTLQQSFQAGQLQGLACKSFRRGMRIHQDHA